MWVAAILTNYVYTRYNISRCTMWITFQVHYRLQMFKNKIERVS